jgi:hypothetical protein
VSDTGITPHFCAEELTLEGVETVGEDTFGFGDKRQARPADVMVFPICPTLSM